MSKITIKASITIWFILGLLKCPISASQIDNGAAAYLERVSFTEDYQVKFLLPPLCKVFIIDQNEAVYYSAIDKGTGIIDAIIPVPDTNTYGYSVFYSDNNGLSSRIPWTFSQEFAEVLMPPTIYGVPNINGNSRDLGFVGSSFPLSSIKLEISLSTNQKINLNSLANSGGEWQIIAPQLPPGTHQAKVRAEFQGMTSGDSQILEILVLAPTDQFIQDLGGGTRKSLERVVNKLPGPARDIARQLDSQSEMISKYILPSLLTLSTLVQSGVFAQNLIYLLLQALIALGRILGLVKQRQRMGIVYDSVSKLPLGRAIVRLYEANNHNLYETDVTSASGVFSFLPPEGYYYLRVSKPGYIFPSKLVLAKRDGSYSPIYSGGECRVTASSAVINVAVPMDPEAYQESWFMKMSRLWQRWFEPINQWLLLFGFFLALLAYSRVPSRLNFAILWLYLMGIIYYWWRSRKYSLEYGLVVNSLGKPLPGVELILTDTEYNRLVSRRVTDEKGRYQFTAPPGNYEIRVVTPKYLLINSAKNAYKGEKLIIEGERGQAKRIIPKIVVKEIERT